MRKSLLLSLAAALMIATVFFIVKQKVTSSPLNVKQLSETSEKQDGYDGPLERGQLEFDKTRDPLLDIVPVERLLGAMYYTQSLQQSLNTGVPGLVWQERGPIFDSVGPSNSNSRGVPVGQQPESYTSGRIRAVLIDRSDVTGNTVWSGSVAGGLWKCTNFTSPAASWQNVNDFFDNLAISSLTQDPSNPDIMYFSTGEATQNADAVLGRGVWKTIDHGATWTQLPSTALFTRNFKITCDNSGNVYLATRGFGLQRSKDKGVSWEDITPVGLIGLNTSFCTDVEITSTGKLLASFGYTTSSGGDANRVQVRYTTEPATVNTLLGWQVPVGLTTDANRIELAGRGDFIYAAPSTRANQVVSIYRSIDGGATWIRSNPVNYPSPINIANGQAWYDLALQVSPVNPNEILVGGLDAYRSTDGGVTVARNTSWVQTPPYVHADHHTYLWEVVGGTVRVIMATDGGLFLSLDNGVSYQDRNENYAIKQFYSGAIHPTRTHYILGGAQDNGSHQIKTPGKTYSIEVTGGDGAYVDIDQVNPNFQYTTYVYNTYRRSSNDGNTWQRFDFSTNRGFFINPFDYDDVQKKLFASFADRAAPNQSLLRWNNPTTATNISNSSLDTIVVSKLIRNASRSNASAFMVSPHTPNRLFVGGHNGSLVRIDNANTVTTSTVDANTTVLTGPSFSGGFINCIAVGSSDNKLLAVFSNYGVTNLWYSGDGGTSWTGIDGNLPDMPVRWALFYPQDDNKLMIATEAGVYTTEAINGASTIWAPSANFPLVRTDMLKLRRTDNLVLAATHGRGFWTTNIPVNVPLPVRGLTLKGNVNSSGQSLLSWSALGATSQTRYRLQYSTDGTNFKEIADLASGQNQYRHQLTAAVGYYRVIAIEPNAPPALSNVILLKTDFLTKGLQMLIAPNPVRSTGNLVISGLETGAYQWQVSNASGHLVQRGASAAQINTNETIPFNVANWPSGVYMIRVVQGRKTVTQSFTKQ